MYLHEDAQKQPAPDVTSEGTNSDTKASEPSEQAIHQPLPSRVFSKPVSAQATENPREFQIGQVRRRYKPKETKGPNGNLILDFKLHPSDPDFPFEVDHLDCSLVVPADYPSSLPSLKVKNKDIPRGFAVNVESGFDGLCRDRNGVTLLNSLKALDRNLEMFLSEKKAETVKLVANADTRHLVDAPVAMIEPVSKPTPVTVQVPVSKRAPVFTDVQKTQAATRRATEIRQLEARLGRLPLFKKSADGIAYTIPIEPRRRQDLPNTLRALKVITLFIPVLYPLQPCRVQLDGVEGPEVVAVQDAFKAKVSEQEEWNMMGHVNYLAANIHVMARVVEVIQPVDEHIERHDVKAEDATAPEPSTEKQLYDDSHIRVVPRPPEWDLKDAEEEDDSDSGSYLYDSGDESTDDSGAEGGTLLPSPDPAPQAITTQAEKGTALSFPFIELYGIELLEISNLNIAVKCIRCKDQNEFTNLKNGISKSEVCKKCAVQLSATFRRDFLHANAVRAGFLDLDACTPADMLPSNFIPTCSNCSAAYPAPGIISVRGETTSNICRECHNKFTFRIPEVKFLRISNSAHIPPSTGPRRKKETLGLVVGTALPDHGRCSHYRKSLRWFRFSCCQKMFACDKCHDEVESHPNEHANRMVCGWCSREQNYRPEDCAICRAGLVGKKGGGFWEGGKGTRDRVRMSRKDKRKYRRAPREGGKKVGAAAS